MKWVSFISFVLLLYIILFYFKRRFFDAAKKLSWPSIQFSVMATPKPIFVLQHSHLKFTFQTYPNGQLTLNFCRQFEISHWLNYSLWRTSSSEIWLSFFFQDEEKRIASVMARKEEDKKKEVTKLAVLKVYCHRRLYLKSSNLKRPLLKWPDSIRVFNKDSNHMQIPVR